MSYTLMTESQGTGPEMQRILILLREGVLNKFYWGGVRFVDQDLSEIFELMQPKVNFASTGNSFNVRTPTSGGVNFSAGNRVVPIATSQNTFGNTGFTTGVRPVQETTVGAPVQMSYPTGHTLGTYDTGRTNTAVATAGAGRYTGSTTGGQVGTAYEPVSHQTISHRSGSAQPNYAVGAAVPASSAGGELVEYDRPYNKIYETHHQRVKKLAPTSDEPTKPNKCCGTPCWALLGLLGLLGTVLGMLFGLGVIGGLPSLGLPGISLPNINGHLSGDGDVNLSPVVIDGVEYPSQSIEIEDSVVDTSDDTNHNGASSSGSDSGSTSGPNSSFQFPPSSKPVNPAPVTPTPVGPVPEIKNEGIEPISVKPVSPVQTNTNPPKFEGISPIYSQPTTQIRSSSSSYDVNPTSSRPVTRNTFSTSPTATSPTTVLKRDSPSPIQVQPILTRPVPSRPIASSVAPLLSPVNA